MSHTPSPILSLFYSYFYSVCTRIVSSIVDHRQNKTKNDKKNANCGSDCFGRCCGGESCCVLNFTNNDRDGKAQYAALVTNEPLAKIVPIDMSSKEVSGSLIVQQGAYMASYGDVRIGFSCDCNFVRCCCGGMVRTN